MSFTETTEDIISGQNGNAQCADDLCDDAQNEEKREGDQNTKRETVGQPTGGEQKKLTYPNSFLSKALLTDAPKIPVLKTV